MFQLKQQLYVRFPVRDRNEGPEFDPDEVDYAEYDVTNRDQAFLLVRERSLFGEGRMLARELCDLQDGGPPQWFELPDIDEEIITDD